MNEFSFQELEESTKNFANSHIIGKGSHGKVYKAILKDGKHVAIKKQSLGLQKLQDNSKLDNEVSILSTLPLNHPFLINFHGVSFDTSMNNKLLVMEFLPNGTLHEKLHESSRPPPWMKRVQILLQIAKAIQTLHESKPPIIHRDIKSANVLFDSNWNAKLCDFGLAIRTNNQGLMIDRPAGTMGYLDPCYTKPSKLSTKNDIFSFGVLLLEVISSRKVIDVSNTPASVVDWVTGLIEEGRSGIEVCDKRILVPRFMVGTITQMVNIGARCVSSKVSNRPSILEIVMEMEKLNCILIEPVRILPIFMNIFRSFVKLKKHRKNMGKKQRKNNNSMINISNPTTIKANGITHGDNIITRKKRLLLSEILAANHEM